jgi:ParB-like chromosome segregation protein Spo0J
MTTGLTVGFNPELRLDSLDGQPVQHRHGILNAAQVKVYAAQFNAGSVCPPVMATRDGHLVYGNHRFAGAEKSGWEALPAFILNVDFADAQVNPHLMASLVSIAVAENAEHGEPYSASDRKQNARGLLNLSFSNRSIAAELGLTAAQVSGVKRELDAEQRLVTLDIDDTYKPSTKRSLSGPDASALNDEPFRQLAAVAADADLTGTEINVVAKDAKASGSDAAAMVVIAEFRRDNAQRITEFATTGRTRRPTPVGKLRGVARQVTSLCADNANAAIYKDHGDTAAETAAMVDDAIACLVSIKAAQAL